MNEIKSLKNLKHLMCGSVNSPKRRVSIRNISSFLSGAGVHLENIRKENEQQKMRNLRNFMLGLYNVLKLALLCKVIKLRYAYLTYMAFFSCEDFFRQKSDKLNDSVLCHEFTVTVVQAQYSQNF